MLSAARDHILVLVSAGIRSFLLPTDGVSVDEVEPWNEGSESER